MPNCGCNDYSRTQLLRRAAAEAGRGLPAIEPGMPMPAGTGLTRRSFVSRASGLALSVYGAASLGPKAFEEGIAAAAAQAPSERVLVSIFLSGGADSLTMLAPTSAHPQYAANRPTLGAAERPGHPAHRGHLAALAPVVRRARGALRRGQGHRDAGDRLRRREPVPLHEPPLLGGRRDEPVRPLGLARALPRPARRGRQPAPGAGARLGPPAGAGRPRRARGDRGRARQLRLLDARACGARCRTRCSTRSATSASCPTSDVGLGQARAAVAATGRLRDQLAPFQDGFTSPPA